MARKQTKNSEGAAQLVDDETGEVFALAAGDDRVEHDSHAIALAYAKTLPVYFKTENNHNTLAEALASATFNREPTKTQQHPMDEVDINLILQKFGVAAVYRKPEQGLFEIPEDLDLRSAIDNLARAQETFNSLPPQIQQHFENIENMVNYVDSAVARHDRVALENVGILERKAPPKTDGEAPSAGKPQGGDSPAPSGAPKGAKAPQTDP